MSLDSIKSWIAGWPSPVRHFVAVFLGAVVATVIQAVVAHGGIWGIDWKPVLSSGLDRGLVLAVASVGVLALTPLTSSYGVGKTPVDPPVPTV